MSETNWPDPASEPETERGESENGLLPSAERVKKMDFGELEELVELVENWEGDAVEQFREAVAERAEEHKKRRWRRGS